MRWLVMVTLLGACGTTELDTQPEPRIDVPWTVDACDPTPAAEGFDQGQVLPDFALGNQFGGTTGLYDFCERTILLQVAGFW